MTLDEREQELYTIGKNFSFAFQPIFNLDTGAPYAYEALVRGLNNEPAFKVISQYEGDSVAPFDAACRVKALHVAASIGLDTCLSLNFLPNAAHDEFAGLDSTLNAAAACSFSTDKIIVEATEGEAIADHKRFAAVVNEYRRVGMRLAIDDFGSGYSGLNLLADFQPDLVKLDMVLIRGIETKGPRQAIARAVSQMCEDLGIEVIAEGVETENELDWLRNAGIRLFQGYLLAKPAFEALPNANISLA